LTGFAKIFVEIDMRAANSGNTKILIIFFFDMIIFVTLMIKKIAPQVYP